MPIKSLSFKEKLEKIQGDMQILQNEMKQLEAFLGTLNTRTKRIIVPNLPKE